MASRPISAFSLASIASDSFAATFEISSGVIYAYLPINLLIFLGDRPPLWKPVIFIAPNFGSLAARVRRPGIPRRLRTCLSQCLVQPNGLVDPRRQCRDRHRRF